MLRKFIDGLIINYFYHRYFKIVIADTDELKEIAYSLRYKVFFEEEDMIEKEKVDLLKMQENNDDDDNSIHFLLYDKKDKEYIGTIRVINPKGKSKTPIFRMFSDKIKSKYSKTFKILPYKESEISRAAILKNNRGLCKESKRKMYAFLFLYLFAGTYLYIKSRNRTFILAQKRLNRQLNMMGIPTYCISENIELFGKRQIYLIDMDNYKRTMPSKIRPLFKSIEKSIKKQKSKN